MNVEELKERLRKLKALADRGEGGERDVAEQLLNKLAAEYDINLVDIDGDELCEYEVKIPRGWQRRLLSQLTALMRQEKAKRGEALREKELRIYVSKFGSKYCKMVEYFVYATKCDWLELTAKFEVLKADYKQQLNNFYLAFLMANDLLTDPDDDAQEATLDQKKAYKAAAFMSLGIKPTKLHKQLEVK